MDVLFLTQGTLLLLQNVIEQFLLDRIVQNLSTGTIEFYRKKLANFSGFLNARRVDSVEQIDSHLVREYLLWLDATGHNPGGIHAHYRAVKALLRWYEAEYEPEGWKNPFRKIKAPKHVEEPLEPVTAEQLVALLETCSDRHRYTDVRDRAILLCLLDTGCRASEFLAVDLNDLDTAIGALTICHGKGRKVRAVFIGKTAKKALRAYLKARRGGSVPALWLTDDMLTRLTYWGLRSMVNRRAKLAGLAEAPSLHSFRRAFAISLLNEGCDLLSISRLLGHSDLSLVARYAKQSANDLQVVHNRAAPADRLRGG